MKGCVTPSDSITIIYIITIQSIQDYITGRDIHDAMNVMHIYFKHLHTLAEVNISLGPLRLYMSHMSPSLGVSHSLWLKLYCSDGVSGSLIERSKRCFASWCCPLLELRHIKRQKQETSGPFGFVFSIKVKRNEDEHERSSVPKQ